MTDRRTLADLEAVLCQRRDERPPGSYTVELLDDRDLVQRKIVEEAFEVCLELGRPAPDGNRVASEAADLLYHLLVGLVACEVPFNAVLDQLDGRSR